MTRPTPLQQFRVHFDRPLEVDIVPDLQPFVSDGLRVDLQYPNEVGKFDAMEGLYESGSPF
jgi:hypothetical protein